MIGPKMHISTPNLNMSELRMSHRQPASHSHHCDGGNSHKTVTVTTNLLAHIFLLSVCTTIVPLGIDSLGESMEHSTYREKSISEPLANSEGQPPETGYTCGGRTQARSGWRRTAALVFKVIKSSESHETLLKMLHIDMAC